MTDCSSSEKSSVLASEFIWSDVPAERVVILVAGILLALTTFTLYFYLICRYRRRMRAFSKMAGSYGHSPKMEFHEALLNLGPITTAFFLVQLCVPELQPMADLFQTSYRAYAYLYLMKYAGAQLGQLHNLVRENGMGTLQHHKPSKIWNKPPCCCIWVFCLRCMKERILSIWDAAFMYRLIYQFCILGPVMSALKMVVHYEGFSAANIKTVGITCNVVSILSMISAAYGTNVMCGMVEACLPIQYQVRQRPWFNQGHGPGQLSEEQLLAVKRTSNISVKNTWIIIVTVLPSLAGLITSFALNEGLCEHGRTLRVEDYKNHLVAFISIVLNFFGVLFALAKAFRFSGDSDRTEILELASARMIELELWPAFVLEVQAHSINGILKLRKTKGVDQDLGTKPSAQWLEAFGEPGSAPGGTPGDESVVNSKGAPPTVRGDGSISI
eukprot:TRINITY_DN669_c0_g1_i1.p1 TRINITY_DN669_c0_g1~~TRINITY_DN669_c0_g1_i1.p1  ORF type:complete len:442 (+),score=49.69 TRINITY_DN669_c0_g1_i1:186-1511(+)